MLAYLILYWRVSVVSRSMVMLTGAFGPAVPDASAGL